MKRITPQNWLEPDPTGAPAGTDPQAWRDEFLAIDLDRKVPQAVAGMFETARGCLIYGRLFAPLVTLGVEHCYWVLEAGVRARCVQLGLPISVTDRQGRTHSLSFAHNLRQLQEKGAVGEEDLALWQQAGELRDWAAQPRHGEQVGPEHAHTALKRAAELLNGLFVRREEDQP
ncbi:MAG: hypothetical protein AB1831_12375 [Pseudomonadota bacterium]